MKIRFNIQTWSNTCLEIKNKINNIILKTVERCTSNVWFGKTLSWKMKKMNIPSYFQLFEDSCNKQIFNILNYDRNNMSYFILTQDRNINLFSQNKCSSFDNNSNSSYIYKQQFTKHARKKYNSLNRGITLSPNKPSFKKWLFKSHHMT